MLTALQIAAIVSLLQAFGVDQSVVNQVQVELNPSSIVIQAPTLATSTPQLPIFGSVAPQATSTSIQTAPVAPPPPPPCDDTPTITITPFIHPRGTNRPQILQLPITLTATGKDYEPSNIVWFAVNMASACTPTAWSDTVYSDGRLQRVNEPNDTYPQMDDRFFSSVSANINANEAGTHEAVIVATDGKTTSTTTLQVITN